MIRSLNVANIHRSIVSIKTTKTIVKQRIQPKWLSNIRNEHAKISC